MEQQSEHELLAGKELRDCQDAVLVEYQCQPNQFKSKYERHGRVNQNRWLSVVVKSHNMQREDVQESGAFNWNVLASKERHLVVACVVDEQQKNDTEVKDSNEGVQNDFSLWYKRVREIVFVMTKYSIHKIVAILLIKDWVHKYLEWRQNENVDHVLDFLKWHCGTVGAVYHGA